MDSRFCAVCNKVSAFGRPRGAIGSVTLPEVLAFLEAEQVQATCGAVGEILGVAPRTLVGQLGERGGEAGDANVISSGIELLMRLSRRIVASGRDAPGRDVSTVARLRAQPSSSERARR